jgi:hypothetical protein
LRNHESSSRTAFTNTTTPGVEQEAAVTIFQSEGGALAKRADLDVEGRLKIGSAVQFVRGSFRTERVKSPTQLAVLVSSLSHNEALCCGVEIRGRDGGSVAPSRAIADGRADGDAIARTKDNFGWSKGPGVLMLDIDLPKAGSGQTLPPLPDPLTIPQLRAVLVGAVPQLASVPMVGLPSASAFIYRTDTGACLRGPTGARFYVLVANATEIPELGRRLHDQLVLARLGFAFISESGSVRVRSLIDTSVFSPERLDFISGAICGPKLVQRRGAPFVWNDLDGRPLVLGDLPALSAAELAELERLKGRMIGDARPEAERVRAYYAEQRKAEGHPVSASWNASTGEIEHLDGEHHILLDDGMWVSVDDVLAEPERFHERNCADPLEPSYGGDDRRIARIYTRRQTTGPVIYSHAHGGVSYLLRASAGADFAVEADSSIAPGSIALSDPLERVAALHGTPDRVFQTVMHQYVGEDVWRLQERLKVAAKAGDPLSGLFHATVLPEARSLRGFANERAVFDALLRSSTACARSADWRGRNEEERALLCRAAWLLVAPATSVGGRISATPGKLLRPALRENTQWTVEGWWPIPGVVAIVGPAGHLKSWILADACGRIASEPQSEALTGDVVPGLFAGRKVRHGSVLYCASEDVHGWRDRAAKWGAVFGEAVHLRVPERPLPLSSLSDTLEYVRKAVTELRDEGAPDVALVVVDTFRGSFVGDENASGDVHTAAATAEAVARMLNATVVLVHHTAKQEDGRARGSTAFEGAMDFIASVKKDGDRSVTLTVTKNKAGPTGATFTWHIGSAGVLHEGPALTRQIDETSATISQRCAQAAVEAVRELAAGNAEGVPRRLVNDFLTSTLPALCGTGLNASTARSNKSRGIAHACEKRWLAVHRGKRGAESYVLGPAAPAPSPLDPGDLEEMLR